MNPLFYVTGILLWTGVLTAPTAWAQPQPDKRQRRDACLRVLRDAMQSAEGFFVRVHAAEFLIMRQQTAHIDSLFTRYQQNPEHLLGATRVLARLHASDPVRRKHYADQILALFYHADSLRQRVIALESLGKLGYNEPLPAIRAQADTGQTAMKAMARWVLANAGTNPTETRLAELLDSPDPLAYRYAAYAFRYHQAVRPATYDRLTALAQRLTPTDPQRVYVLSALWVHEPVPQAAATKVALLTYRQGSTGERYELAEALSRRGTPADLPLLDQLLHDASQDVRVAASNAMLSIDERY